MCHSPLTAYPVSGGVVFSKPSGHSGRTIQLPCKQCLHCRLTHAAEWGTRFMAESLFHGNSWFLTLTQDDEHASAWSSLDKAVLQAFWHRWRERGAKLRYGACGEYGDNTHRAHYHAAVFGPDIPGLEFFRKNERGERLYTSDWLSELWGRGFVTVAPLDAGTAGYVAGYCLRDMRAKQAGWYDTVTPSGEYVERALPFFTMSRRPGIGRGFVERYGAQFEAGDFMIAGGRKVPTPKYFHRVLEAQSPELAAELQLRREAEVYSDRAKRERRPGRLEAKATVLAAKLGVARRGTRRGAV